MSRTGERRLYWSSACSGHLSVCCVAAAVRRDVSEVMSRGPGFGEAFTPVSGGRSRLRMKDLDITIAACLTSHALNIGYEPVVKKGVEAPERDRIGHVDLNYLRPETYAAANGP